MTHSADAAPAITKVSVLSTGHVAIRPEHVRGNGTPMLWWLLTSRRWTAPRPINVYVIEHRDGLLLWDTGAGPPVGHRPALLSGWDRRLLLPPPASRSAQGRR